MTFVQRFHSALGSFVHFHLVCPDGVFTRAASGVVSFHVSRAPSREEIASVAERVEKAMTRWLRKRNLIDERPLEERSCEAPELTPLEACMQLSLFGGTFLRLGRGAVEEDGDEHRRGKQSPWTGEVRGFNIHAGVLIHKGSREGLERLCRYGARPPFSLERISLLPDGRVAYRLKKPRRNGATHLVMTPVQFLARIAILIPPPRYPLQRFAGVLAPNSSWRRAVVAMRPPTKLPRSGEPPRPPPPKKNTRKKKGPAADLVFQYPGHRASGSASTPELPDPGRANTMNCWSRVGRSMRVWYKDGFGRPGNPVVVRMDDSCGLCWLSSPWFDFDRAGDFIDRFLAVERNPHQRRLNFRSTRRFRASARRRWAGVSR